MGEVSDEKCVIGRLSRCMSTGLHESGTPRKGDFDHMAIDSFSVELVESLSCFRNAPEFHETGALALALLTLPCQKPWVSEIFGCKK